MHCGDSGVVVGSLPFSRSQEGGDALLEGSRHPPLGTGRGGLISRPGHRWLEARHRRRPLRGACPPLRRSEQVLSCVSPVWPCLLNAAARLFSLCSQRFLYDSELRWDVLQACYRAMATSPAVPSAMQDVVRRCLAECGGAPAQTAPPPCESPCLNFPHDTLFCSN